MGDTIRTGAAVLTAEEPIGRSTPYRCFPTSSRRAPRRPEAGEPPDLLGLQKLTGRNKLPSKDH
jgi:hypothetical protein